MAPKAEITSWADDTTGKKYVQIQGKIYEELSPARPGRHPPAPDTIGWGDVPGDQCTADGWQAAGAKRGKRWQRAHRLQEKQLSLTGGGKGGGKSSGQKQPPGATAAGKKSTGKGTYKGGSRPKGGAYHPSTSP